MVHLFTPRASSLHTSSLSRSFTSILNINPTCFSYSPEPLFFNNSSFPSIQQLFVPFSPRISDFSIPLLCHFYPRRYDSESAISLHASTPCQLFSGLAVPIQLNFPFLQYSFSNLQFRDFVFNLSLSSLRFPFVSALRSVLKCWYDQVDITFDCPSLLMLATTSNGFDSVYRVPSPVSSFKLLISGGLQIVQHHLLALESTLVNHLHCVHFSPFCATHILPYRDISHPYIHCFPSTIQRHTYVDLHIHTIWDIVEENALSNLKMMVAMPTPSPPWTHVAQHVLLNSLPHLLLQPVHTARVP